MKRVVITRRAANEIVRNYEWMAERSRTSADRWRNRLLTAVETLALDPDQHPLAPEDEIYDGTLREFLTGRKPHVFRVLFEIRGNEVVILRVRHGRQDTLTDVS